MPGGKYGGWVENPLYSEKDPEERQAEYLERRDRLRRVLMNRRATSTKAKETNESGPEVSPNQENLNDASTHENEPTKSTKD